MKYLKMLEICKDQKQVKVLSHISKAMPFVFDTVEETSEILVAERSVEKVDLPFPVCSFEMLGEGETFLFVDKYTGTELHIYCIVAEELEPGKIIYHVVSTLGVEYIKYDCFHPDDFGRNKWLMVNMMVDSLLQQLKNGQHGHTSPRTVFKWKDGGEKKQVRINKVIHVRPRNGSEAGKETGTRNVTWSHAFWVMGHWRTISGIGKNRDGEYRVSGKTWVEAFVKNSELGDPVKKIRLVRNESGENPESEKV